MRFNAFAFIALFLFALPQSGMAHQIDNLGVVPPDPDPPRIEAPVHAEPIADIEVQKMAFDMEHARCEDLMKLEPEVRRAFLITTMFLQRKGSLGKIVGPDCMFLGETERVAAIADTSLTLGSDRESLYFLPEMHALIVSDTARDFVAYGLIMHDDTADPVEYFLAHRDEAEQSAAVARIFAENVVAADPPRAALPELATEIRDVAPSSSLPKRIPSNAPVSSEATQVGQIDSATATSEPTAPGTPGTAVQGEETEESVAVSQAGGNASAIRPIGPEPEPSQETNSGLWILIAFFALIGIGVLIVVLRKQVSPKQGMIDE